MGKTGQTKEYSSLDIGYFLLFLAFIASKKLTYIIMMMMIMIKDSVLSFGFQPTTVGRIPFVHFFFSGSLIFLKFFRVSDVASANSFLASVLAELMFFPCIL